MKTFRNFGSLCCGLLLSLVLGQPAVKGADPLAALSFSGGTNKYAYAEPAAAFDSYPLTVSFWVKTVDAGSLRWLVSKYLGGSYNGWTILADGGRLRGWYFHSAGRYVWDGGLGMDGGFIADGKWHHVAMVVDGAGGAFFVDGKRTSAMTWTGEPGAADNLSQVRVGSYDARLDSLTGAVDEISIWTVAKTLPEIAALQRAPLAGNEPGLAAYWKCDGEGNQNVPDSSPNQRLLQTINSPFTPSGLAFGSATAPGQAADNPGKSFQDGGAKPWTVDTAVAQDGVSSARSGGITHSQSSSMITTFEGPGTLSFQWKVSSEASFDFLSLFVDGVFVTRISGEVPWTPVSHALGAGSHTVEWRYSKDHSLSAPIDAGWVDRIAFVPPPGDLATHHDARVNRFDFSGRAMVDDSVEAGQFKAWMEVDLQRLDETALPPASEDVPVRIGWVLRRVTGAGAPVILESGAHDFTVPLETHGGGAAPVPATALLRETFSVGVSDPLAIDPGASYDLVWEVRLFPGTAEEMAAGQGTSDAVRLMAFSGQLLAGATEARFERIGFAPGTFVQQPDFTWHGLVDLNPGTISLPDFPATAFQLTPEARYLAGAVRVAYDPVSRDLSILAGERLAVGDVPGSLPGIALNSAGAHLSAAGLAADQFRVRLPAGFGVVASPTSRLLDGEISFPNVPLGGDGLPQTTTLTYAPANLHLCHDKLPLRYAAASLTCDLAAGTFTAPSATPVYVRKREREWLADDAVRGAILDPSSAVKASNEGHYALADNAGPVSVLVRANEAGVALLTTSVPLSTPVPETFAMHFPKAASLSVTGGSVTVTDSVFTAGQLLVDAPVSISYKRNPNIAATCGLSFFSPSTETIPVSATNGELAITPDGGWRAAGTVPPGTTVEWGGLHGTQATHEISGLTEIGLHLPGHVLPGNDGVAAISRRPSAMLLSGFGSPADPTRIERPETAAYDEGLADYAGLNLRNSGGSLSARSHLGQQDTGNYGLKTLSKYVLRPGGITGVHDAVTAQVPPLQFYGYMTLLDGLRLSYLDSENRESATGGSMTLPFPSDFTVAFERLTFTPGGALDDADLPENTPQKTLSYWGCTLKPDVLDFVQSKDCLTNAATLTLAGEIGLGFISSDKVRGTLAFSPAGKLLPSTANLAVDTSLPVPPNMAIKGRGDLSYPFVPSTRLRFNNYDAAPGGAGAGFLFAAGSMDVPFFDNLRVLLHLHPSKIDSACHVIGGWPSDPSQTDRGWTVGGKNYFNDSTFDPADHGYDTGVDLAEFRGGFDQHGGIDDRFRPHVHKQWRKITRFEFPMRWDARTRQFLPADDKSIELLVLTAAGQVKKLDAAGAEMTFGVEFAGLPKLNTETFSRVLGDATGYLGGSPEKKIADALTNALQGVIDRSVIHHGNRALDEMFADSITGLMREPLAEGIDSVLNSWFELNLLEPMANAHAAGVDAGTGLSDAKAVALAKQIDFQNILQADLGSYVSAALREADRLGGKLDQANAALGQLEILCDPDQTSGTLIHALARRVAQEFLGQDFLGSADPLVGGPLNELADQLLEDARPALRQIHAAIVQQRAQLQAMRNSLTSTTSSLGKQVNDAFSPAAVGTIAQQSLAAFANEIGDARDPKGNYFDPGENSADKLRARLRAHVIDRFHASSIEQSLKRALRQFVAPVREVGNQALNLAFAEVNHMVNEIALKIVTEISQAIGDNEALQELAATANDSFNDTQSALGDFKQKYDSASKVLEFGKLQGYARTRGDSLDALRLDASIGLAVPDPFGFQGFVEIKNQESGVPSTSGRAPGIVATEVTVGSTFGGTLYQPVPATDGGPRQPDRAQPFRAAVRGRFSFGPGAGGNFPVPIPNGFDGNVDFETQIDLGLMSIQRLQLAVGLGGQEAYASAFAKGSIWFVPVEGRVFMGSTRQVGILKEAFDPQTYELVVTKGSQFTAPGSPFLVDPVIGIYTRFAGQLSLNRFFGIPDNPNLISLNAGREFGHFALISRNQEGTQLKVGYREALTVSGTALRVIGVSAKAGFLVAVDANLTDLTGASSITEALNSVKGTGTAFVEACATVLLVKKCLNAAFYVDVHPNPALVPPIIVVPVGFEY
jgi:hypothetical protein